MSAQRPKLTSSMVVTAALPIMIQSSRLDRPGASGSTCRPLKMAGSEIMVTVWLIDAMSIPMVVLVSATHL